jgi:hypothetical protein
LEDRGEEENLDIGRRRKVERGRGREEERKRNAFILHTTNLWQ